MTAIVAPYAFSAGDIETAARLNTRSSAITQLQTPPHFSATQNAAQSVATGSGGTAGIFQNTLRDSDAGYSSGTGVYTVKTAGLWCFSGSMLWATNATGFRFIEIVSTAGLVAYQYILASADSFGRMSAVLTVPCSVNDTVFMLIAQTSGGALNTAGNAQASFSGFRVSI